MSVKKYFDYAGLQYYDSKWKLKFQEMIISDNELNDILFDELDIIPPLPTTFSTVKRVYYGLVEQGKTDLDSDDDLYYDNNYYDTDNFIDNNAIYEEVSDSECNISLNSIANSNITLDTYYTENETVKSNYSFNITVPNASSEDASYFYVKLKNDSNTFPSENFIIKWSNNVEWENGAEPDYLKCVPGIIHFRKETNKWIGRVFIVRGYGFNLDYSRYGPNLRDNNKLSYNIEKYDLTNGIYNEVIINLATGNSFSFEPEGNDNKHISILNEDKQTVFYLKLIDPGNFLIHWDENIQWSNGSEPQWVPFNEYILRFKRSGTPRNYVWTGRIVQTSPITPYWKFGISSESIEIPLILNSPATIDWGDGTIETIQHSENSVYCTHTYESSNSEEYNIIKISSNDFENAYFLQNKTYESVGNFVATYIRITGGMLILSPLPKLKGCCYIDESQSPVYIDNSFSSIFWGLSFEKHYITNKHIVCIPEKIFHNNSHITDFSECFMAGPQGNLFGGIPDDIFRYNVNAINFEFCFGGHNYGLYIDYIPDDIFKYNVNAVNFEDCFREIAYEGETDINIYIGSSNVTNAGNFISFYGGEPDNCTIRIPANSTTKTTFDNAASSIEATIIEV